jgi:hypothetical protein
MNQFRVSRKAIGFVATLLLAFLAGCSSSTPPARNAALEHSELTFDLDKCQSQGAGLYKCPAMDKVICGADYTGPPVECIRTGKKGNIYVQELAEP